MTTIRSNYNLKKLCAFARLIKYPANFMVKKLQFITPKFPKNKELLNTLANYNSTQKFNKNG